MVAPYARLPLMAALLLGSAMLQAQTEVFFQGFENDVVACTGENWPYTGGVRNIQTARTGSWSLRLGRQGESNSVIFTDRNVTGLDNIQLQVYHSVLPAPNPMGGDGHGLDVREGAVMLVRLNGGAWTPIGRVGGFDNHNYAWNAATGGAPSVSAGCNVYQAPNPLLYDVPAGTTTIGFRVISIGLNGSTCATFNTAMNAGTTPSLYDRTDEGFYIDDLRLTTTTTPLPGIWTGAASTDWFNCANWSFGYVPTAVTPVRIEQTASAGCIVGVTGTATAECASILHRSTTGTSRNLTVSNGSTLNIHGPLTVERSNVNTALVTGVVQSSMLSATSINLIGSAPGNYDAVVRAETNGTRILVETDVTINGGGLLDLESFAGGGRLELGRDFINLRDETHFHQVNSTVVFNGNGAQTISTANGSEVFHNLRVEKTGGDLSLLSPVQVNNQLALVDGRVFTTPAELLTLGATATVPLSSDASFVHGPMEKIGLVDFMFPVGKGSSLRPCGVGGIAGVAGDAFMAEYFPASAREFPFANVLEPTLDHVSDCEYWSIERSHGSPNATVRLTWDTPESCGVTDLPSLRVAYWDVAIWRDRGNGGATGDVNSGIIPTSGMQTDFGDFTLASINGSNPLPITLLHFRARPEFARVRLDWATAMELDNDHFTVERSADGLHFADLLQVPGAGHSHTLLHYLAWDDRPLGGISYYRLRQTDHDGTSAWSDVVAVRFEGPGALNVWAVGGVLQVQHPLPADALLELFDAAGRLLLGRIAGGEGLVTLDVGMYVPGVYLLRASHGDRVLVARFFR